MQEYKIWEKVQLIDQDEVYRVYSITYYYWGRKEYTIWLWCDYLTRIQEWQLTPYVPPQSIWFITPYEVNANNNKD